MYENNGYHTDDDQPVNGTYSGAQCSGAQNTDAQNNEAQEGAVQYGSTRSTGAQNVESQESAAQYGSVQGNAPQYGNTQYSGALYGNAQYSNSQYGNAQGNSAQYSNTQYNYGNTYGAYDNQYGKKKEKKKGGFLKKAAVFAACGILFGLFAGAGFYGIQKLNEYLDGGREVIIQSENDALTSNKESNATASPVINASETKVITSDVTEVVEDVMPAMVSIINSYVTKTTYFGQTFERESRSTGSGIIIGENEEELLIATNYHVIADADALEVTFIDGSTAQAQVKGKDSNMDLAVIAINVENLSADTRSAITIAELGDSDSLKLGEPVIAIGNALGYGQSVTGGWVSALNREITMEDGSVGTFIQTDAAINSGNSGGALLNIEGEVIGINSSKIGGYGIEGMGYAIPISAAEPIISDLMTRETKEKVTDGNVGYMGINYQTITDDIAYMYNFPTGVFVRSVEENSPAAQAGLRGGDIITNFDGEKISTADELLEALQYCAPGSTASVIVKRQMDGEYREMELEITLGERPAE